MRKETQTSVENLLEALEKNREGVNDAFEQLRNDIGSKAHDLHKANQDDKANGIKNANWLDIHNALADVEAALSGAKKSAENVNYAIGRLRPTLATSQKSDENSA